MILVIMFAHSLHSQTILWAMLPVVFSYVVFITPRNNQRVEITISILFFKDKKSMIREKSVVDPNQSLLVCVFWS